jgi:hypothetical protein
MHVVLEFAPIAALDVPAGHRVQEPAVAFRYWPLLQSASHAVTLKSHGAQARSLNDSDVMPNPLGHAGVHTVALKALTSPGAAPHNSKPTKHFNQHTSRRP